MNSSPGCISAVEDEHLRRMAGGDRERRRAAFERRDALLQHGVGRVADAGIDVAEGLQPEQRGGVVDVVEHEGGGLVDRRRARAGGRVGLRAGMDGERGEAGSAVGHGARPGAVGANASADGAGLSNRGGASRQDPAVALIRNRRTSFGGGSRTFFYQAAEIGINEYR